MNKLTARKIAVEASAIFGVNPDLLFGKSRKRSVVKARQVAIYVTRKLTDLTLEEIGSLFNRTHATIIHAIKAVDSDRTLLLRATAIGSSIMDIDILNKVREYLGDCHLEFPRIEHSPDLSRFEKQPCEMNEFSYEMVKQYPGGGIDGDVFTGEMAFPIGNDKFLIVEYCT